uniref:Uncharacterized protein n=1 Tax=Anopheles farauti TaxID=69004 RepID=A0A182Q1G8_9DIPT
MGPIVRFFVLLVSFCSAIRCDQENDAERTVFDCIELTDFRTPLDVLPSDCQQSFDRLLPTQTNIQRFLNQFDNDIQESAQNALKRAFIEMLQDDGDGSEVERPEEPTLLGSMPDSIPADLRHEILRYMLQGHRFRLTPMLRARLYPVRNILLSQRNYGAVFWIDRLLKPDAHRRTVVDKIYASRDTDLNFAPTKA